MLRILFFVAMALPLGSATVVWPGGKAPIVVPENELTISSFNPPPKTFKSATIHSISVLWWITNYSYHYNWDCLGVNVNVLSLFSVLKCHWFFMHDLISFCLYFRWYANAGGCVSAIYLLQLTCEWCANISRAVTTLSAVLSAKR